MAGRIVYLHGFASGPGSKKGLYLRDCLRRCGHSVEIPDLTAGNFEGLTIGGQLSLMERLCDGSPVTLIGSSMGGWLAALYAARHPEVERLVLLAPAFGFARHFAAQAGAAALEEWRRTGWLSVFDYAARRPARVGYRLLEEGLAYEDYPDVPQAVLVFHGLRDTVVPCSYSEEFARSHPNARLEIVDSDHELLSALPEIGRAVCAFLGSK